MKMFSRIFLVVLAASAASAEIVEEVGDNWKRVVDCISSFTFCKGPEDYKFVSPSGDPIKLFCPVFRTARCKYVNMVFSDGVNDVVKCGKEGPFQIIGQTSAMTAKLVGVGGYVDCMAKTQHEPRNYTDLHVDSVGSRIKIQAPTRYASEQTDNAWQISTTPGNKVSLTCFSKLAKKIKKECVKDILTINDGESTKQYCGYRKVTAKSSGSELVMRLETFQATGGAIRCTAKAVRA